MRLEPLTPIHGAQLCGAGLSVSPFFQAQDAGPSPALDSPAILPAGIKDGGSDFPRSVLPFAAALEWHRTHSAACCDLIAFRSARAPAAVPLCELKMSESETKTGRIFRALKLRDFTTFWRIQKGASA